MKRLFTALCLIIMMGPALKGLSAKEKKVVPKKIAILSITPHNTPRVAARIVKSTIEYSLFKTKYYEVLERGQIEAIMKERVHYLTPSGLKKVKKELEYLSTVKRQEIADRLQFAIQQGDISENADYEVAKQDQAYNEGKIRELELVVLQAKLIEDDGSKDEVKVGCKVTVAEEGFPPETYTIVGPTEASPSNGRISHESPVGAALLGKRVGDLAHVQTPSGQIEFQITAIE